MAQAGRKGDQAHCPSDSHGCPKCPHDVQGPAVEGSSDVEINGRDALRVGDRGAHGSCCGPNQWQAVGGAPGVFINGQKAHRVGDHVAHCGGDGVLETGSGNVLIGDLAGGSAVASYSAHRTCVTSSTEVTSCKEPSERPRPRGVRT